MLAVDFTYDIAYDRHSGNFRATLEGTTVGFYGSYHEAQTAIDRFILSTLASATTFHAADLVADEVRYNAFLAIPDEPPPDDAPGSDDENGTPHEALDVCPSCGDQLTWAGPGLCGACQEAGKTFPFLLALS